MPAQNSELLTRREVSALSGATLRTVDKAVEQNVLRPEKRGNSTLFWSDDVAVIALLVEIKKADVGLSVSAMRGVRVWLGKQPTLKPGAVFSLGAVEIKVPASVVETRKQADLYLSMKSTYINSDPEVLGGEPVIAGTRVPARTIAALVDAGESPQRIAEEFSGVSAAACEAAARWSASNPRRGRPTRTNAGVRKTNAGKGRATFRAARTKNVRTGRAVAKNSGTSPQKRAPRKAA